MSDYIVGALVGGLLSIVGVLLALHLKPKTEIDLKAVLLRIEEHFNQKQAVFDRLLDSRKDVAAKLHRLVQDARTAQRAFDHLSRHVSVEDDDFVADTASALQSLSPFLLTLSAADGILLPSEHQEGLREVRRQFAVVFLNLSVSRKDREKQATRERVASSLEELSKAVVSLEETVRRLSGIDFLTELPDPRSVVVSHEHPTKPLKRTAGAAA